MKNIVPIAILVFLISISSINITNAMNDSYHEKNAITQQTSDGYGLQWMMEYGSSPWTDARYQGPQPIGDADNDGLNELLISGRDSAIRVMEWNENTQTYEQNHILRPPLFQKIYGFNPMIL